MSDVVDEARRLLVAHESEQMQRLGCHDLHPKRERSIRGFEGAAPRLVAGLLAEVERLGADLSRRHANEDRLERQRCAQRIRAEKAERERNEARAALHAVVLTQHDGIKSGDHHRAWAEARRIVDEKGGA